MKETNRLKKLREAFPRSHELIDSITIARGFTAKQVIEFQRELRLELFKCLESPAYIKAIIFEDNKTLSCMFLFDETTKGADYWYYVDGAVNDKLYSRNF